MILHVLFWLCAAAIVYTFVGYAIHVRLLNALLRRDREKMESPPESAPSISIVLVVRNEEERIEERISNLVECAYDGDRELIVVADGCEDRTVEKVNSIDCAIPVHVVVKETAEGKASGLNSGVRVASGEILVFADARQQFDREALKYLVRPLVEDENVSAVSGNLEIRKSEDGAAVGMDLYWKLERWIRNEESKWDSVMGCTGAIYALRRCEFFEIPPDTLIDDVAIPMQTLVRGNRVLFEPKALAYDPQTLHTEQESRRKIRTLAGNYQLLFRYPAWLLPWKNRCWWQLLSHKYLRLAGPGFLLGCFFASLLLAKESPFFQFILFAQLGCYFLALVGLLWKSCSVRAVTIPAGFVFLQWQSMRALGYYLKNCVRNASGVWES